MKSVLHSQLRNSSVFWMLPIRPFSNAAIRVRPCQKSHPMPVSRMSVLMLTCCRAVQGIRFLNENGFAVPKDVSVAGFDDIPMCEMISPALTTVRQDGALRAKIAIEKLRELKENRDTETTITLPVQLVERESTGQYTTRRD